jgi:hypothetical protein
MTVLTPEQRAQLKDAWALAAERALRAERARRAPRPMMGPMWREQQRRRELARCWRDWI